MNKWVILYLTADGMEGEYITMAANTLMAIDNFEEYVKETGMTVIAAMLATERD